MRPRGGLVGPSEGVGTKNTGASQASAMPAADDVDLSRAHELALAIDRAARHGPIRPTCLARSLALKDLLDREGLAGARIRFGVRKREGCFEAHAWVEIGGRGLGADARLLHAFEPIARLESLGTER